MTIDDFIDTYKLYAENYRKETYNMSYSTQQRDYARNKAREYEQLAEWLELLKKIMLEMEKDIHEYDKFRNIKIMIDRSKNKHKEGEKKDAEM